MEMDYKDALILKLSGTAEWKNANEMIVPKEFTKGSDCDHYTIDFIKDKEYILRAYWDDGSLSGSLKYINDEPHGRVLWRYKSGKKLIKAKYHNGQLHGKYIVWWKNGNKNMVRRFKYGKIHGKSIEWYESGKIRKVERYKDGYLNGKCVYMCHKTYDKGKLKDAHGLGLIF